MGPSAWASCVHWCLRGGGGGLGEGGGRLRWAPFLVAQPVPGRCASWSPAPLRVCVCEGAGFGTNCSLSGHVVLFIVLWVFGCSCRAPRQVLEECWGGGGRGGGVTEPLSKYRVTWHPLLPMLCTWCCPVLFVPAAPTPGCDTRHQCHRQHRQPGLRGGAPLVLPCPAPAQRPCGPGHRDSNLPHGHRRGGQLQPRPPPSPRSWSRLGAWGPWAGSGWRGDRGGGRRGGVPRPSPHPGRQRVGAQ
jgi:hypothetical protein